MSVVSLSSYFSSRAPVFKINVQTASFIDHLSAIVAGIAVRIVIDTVNNQDDRFTGALIGVWEGVVVLHFIKKTPKSFDPHVAYGVRIFIDYLLTESLMRLFMTLIFTGMGILLADIAPAIWAESGLRRLWRHLRRDIYTMTQSVPSINIPYFARPRIVRFLPSRAPSVVTSAPPSPSVITITTQAHTPVPRKRPVPGGFPSYVSETETEFSTRTRSPVASDYSTLTGNTRLRRPTVHTESEASYDPDAENRSSSSSLTPTPALSEADLPNIDDVEDMEQEVVLEEAKEETTPRPLPVQLPPTPSNSALTFLRPQADEQQEVPPPSATLPQIPDDDGWENISRREAEANPTPPASQSPAIPEPTVSIEEQPPVPADVDVVDPQQTSNETPEDNVAAVQPPSEEPTVDQPSESQLLPPTTDVEATPAKDTDTAPPVPPKTDGDDWSNEDFDTVPISTTTQSRDIFSSDRPPSYAQFEFSSGGVWDTIGSSKPPTATASRMPNVWGNTTTGALVNPKLGTGAGNNAGDFDDFWEQGRTEQAQAPGPAVQERNNEQQQQQTSTGGEVAVGDLLGSGSVDVSNAAPTTSLEETSTSKPEDKNPEPSTSQQAEVQVQPETSTTQATTDVPAPEPSATAPAADNADDDDGGEVIDEVPFPEKNTERLDAALHLRREIIMAEKDITAAKRSMIWSAPSEQSSLDIKRKEAKLAALKARAEKWHLIVSDGDEDAPPTEVDLSEAAANEFVSGFHTAIICCLLKNVKTLVIQIGKVTGKAGKARKTAICTRLDKLDLPNRTYQIGQKEITITFPTSNS